MTSVYKGACGCEATEIPGGSISMILCDACFGKLLQNCRNGGGGIVHEWTQLPSEEEIREAYKHCKPGATFVYPQDKWISVEDRLPEINEEILIVIRSKYGRPYKIRVGIYSGNDEWEDDAERYCPGTMGVITHWMPLPEVPK